jgi:chemotaxis-related protein WspD
MEASNTGKRTEACWKETGVWGKAKRLTCPHLENAIHCRNCKVFIEAGRSLLERELLPERREEWAQALTAKKEESFTESRSVLVFRVEREWLALPSLVFDKIIDAENFRSLLHRIPHKNNPVLMGIISVEGRIRPCVSFRHLLGLETLSDEERSKQGYQRLALLNSDNGPWVFKMDEIYGVYHLHDAMLKNVPVTVEKDQSTFTKGMFTWKEQDIALLDENLVFHQLMRCVQ